MGGGRRSLWRRRHVAAAGLPALLAVLASGLVAPVPARAVSTLDTRGILLTASTGKSEVKALAVRLDIAMSAGAVVNRMTEGPRNDRSDSSLTGITLGDATGAPMAELSAGLAVVSNPAKGIASVTTVDSSTNPRSVGAAQQFERPDLTHVRHWSADVVDRQGRTVVSDNVVLDVRFRKLAPAMTVTQSVLAKTEERLTVAYAATSASGQTVSVTVDLSTRLSTSAPYQRGAIQVSDSDGRDGGVSDSSQPTADPTSPLVRLQQAVRHLGELDAGSLRGLDKVRDLAQDALSEYAGGETSLPTVTRLIASALSEASSLRPPDARSAAALSRARDQLVATSQRVAHGLLGAARGAGVAPGTVAAIQEAIDRGVAAVAAGDIVGGGAAFDDATKVAAGSVVFNMDRFKLGLLVSFEAKSDTVGYQYVISQNGKFVGSWDSGSARTDADDPQTGQDINKRQLVASVSKIPTAVAVLQLLEKRGLDPMTEPISKWLPLHWKQGPGIGQVTFAHVLQHRSTWIYPADDNPFGHYFTVRQFVADGVNNEVDVKTGERVFRYMNVNSSLLGLLMVRLWDESPPALTNVVFPGFFTDMAWFGLAPDVYRDYVQKNVFGPSGTSGSCAAEAVDPTMYYQVPYSSDPGIPSEEWWLSDIACAHGGWHMSTFDLAEFMAHLRFGNLLSKPYRNLMYEKFLGWIDYTGSRPFGPYHGHGGDLGAGSGEGMHACIMDFSIGVQVALLINSSATIYDGAYQCNTISNAFDNAWVPS